ncbi:MAG: AAA family ATPase [Clostridiales bacterium]|jgi:predicted ATPase|nr:AAA family ATPase [Clostridiales bacterium]
MKDVFITKIHLERLRHLENLDIIISDTERKHLILTGKNGSGKTSLLEALLEKILTQQKIYRNSHGITFKDEDANNALSAYAVGNAMLDFSLSEVIANYLDFTFVYIPTSRKKYDLPKSIEPINIEGKTIITRNASKSFLSYIIYFDYSLYGAKSENNKKLEANLQKWFDNFRSALCNIYECSELALRRDTKNLAFQIVMPGREPFGLHQMSDGYAAFLDIYMELLMRFESSDAIVEYDRPAIVLIDEIETHLHVELQKRVLPFLTKMFPHVQFIVSTHSPFVISSLSNAVVFDLETKERLENPGIYSYEAVVEGFLNEGQYSDEMKKIFNRYRELHSKESSGEWLSETEKIEFQQLISTLQLVPPASKELYLAFRTMEDKRRK